MGLVAAIKAQITARTDNARMLDRILDELSDEHGSPELKFSTLLQGFHLLRAVQVRDDNSSALYELVALSQEHGCFVAVNQSWFVQHRAESKISGYLQQRVLVEEQSSLLGSVFSPHADLICQAYSKGLSAVRLPDARALPS